MIEAEKISDTERRTLKVTRELQLYYHAAQDSTLRPMSRIFENFPLTVRCLRQRDECTECMSMVELQIRNKMDRAMEYGIETGLALGKGK